MLNAATVSAAKAQDFQLTILILRPAMAAILVVPMSRPTMMGDSLLFIDMFV
jgi:hypothetical protein